MSNNRSIFKWLLRLLKWLGFSVLLFFTYVGGCLGYATYTDYAPVGVSSVPIEKNGALDQIADSTLSFTSWNIGYAGLGKESDFFYNGGGIFSSSGRMVIPPEALVNKNRAGILKTIGENVTDFMLFQEVDRNSSRSYRIDQEQLIQAQLPQHSRSFAINFDVNRIPTPLLEPWNIYGEANSGLNSYARYAPSHAERHQLPGKFGWPNDLFLLDRCLLLQRYPTAWGKELILIHVHNSAYDRKGLIKQLQMDYLRNLLIKEYEAGNYVVVGGDWNQCPPGFAFDQFFPGTPAYTDQPNIATDYMPADWQWLYDSKVPTIRSTGEIYEDGSTFTSLIDFFLISPNIQALKVKGIDQGFEYSDHQRVVVDLRLK